MPARSRCSGAETASSVHGVRVGLEAGHDERHELLEDVDAGAGLEPAGDADDLQAGGPLAGADGADGVRRLEPRVGPIQQQRRRGQGVDGVHEYHRVVVVDGRQRGRGGVPDAGQRQQRRRRHLADPPLSFQR